MEIRKNASLRPYNTFGVEAKAKMLVEVHNMQELQGILGDKNPGIGTPLILGGGSNILLTGDVNRLVVLNRIRGIELVHEDNDCFYVSVGAGENWHQFVLHCLENDWAGVENLSLIPGNVGAAPMQNIGAYGVELKETFWRLDAVDIETGEVLTFDNNDCEFGYRTSIFKTRLKNKAVITKVGLKLYKEPQLNISYGSLSQELERLGVSTPTIQTVSQAVINIRRSKLPDPAQIGNAGSFFKNPVIPAKKFEMLKKDFPEIPSYPVPGKEVKVPAGWLIEQAGWKGKTFDGRYGVHNKQALVLVNYGDARGAEIYDLSQQILENIEQKFGITLEREVNVV